MGLTSLWSNITGPRGVKEITPQTQCSWLENNRPQTSASTRTVKNLAQLQLKPEVHKDSRPTTAQDGQKKKRSLSISRPKLMEASKKERKGSSTRGSDNVPEVPALPPALSPRSRGPSDEPIRPGTAIAASRSLSATERFELPGNGLPSPNFQSPLPSPRSPTFPRSPESHLTLASQEDAPPMNEGGLRKRSNSTASGKSKLKRASWFVSGGKKKAAEAELPPPLPPPSGPPPPPPVVQPLVAELPATALPLEHNNSCESVPETPLSAPTKISLDSDSILNAFPSVPVPIPAQESSTAPEAVQRDSAVLDSSSTTSLGADSADDSATKRQSPLLLPAARPRPIVAPTQTIDGLLAHEPTMETLRHDSKDLPALPVEAITENKTDHHGSLTFSEELQQEYDRLMEVMGEKPNPGAVMRVIGGFEFKKQAFQDPQKFSNDEALSKLEFGILQ